jgi:hypothetical protein
MPVLNPISGTRIVSGLCPTSESILATGFNGQMIMILPDLDVLAVTTARENHNFGEFASSIYNAVNADSSLPADATNAKLLAEAILDVSTQKPTMVAAIPNIATTISGKVYHFPPKKIGVKSLSLVVADSELHHSRPNLNTILIGLGGFLITQLRDAILDCHKRLLVS